MAEPIVLGIVGIKNMGTYNADTKYDKLNVVTYQGSTYCALKETKGNLPTNTEYWQLYAEKGEPGDIRGFASVAEMKLDQTLANGNTCQTLGYYSVNDGGNALYKIRTITDDDVVDEKSIISLYDDTLIAELITNEYVTPELFGAYGDGTHDDTDAIQSAIDYFGTTGGKVVFSAKIYKIDGVIEIKNKAITLEGVQTTHHNTGTILKAGENENNPLIKVYNTETRVVGGSIKNIALYGSDARYNQTNGVNRIGLYIRNTAEFMLDNVNINGFLQEGLYADQWWDSTVYNLQITACGNDSTKYAIYLTSTNDSTNSIKFTACHFEYNNLFLHLDHLASNIHFEECKFEKGNWAGTPNQLILVDEGVYNVMFVNCFFTENDGTHPVFNIKNNYTSITNCSFSSGVANKGYWINHNGNGNNTGNGLIVSNNYFNENTNDTNAIKLENNAIFTNNIMDVRATADTNIVVNQNAIIKNNIIRASNSNANTIIKFTNPTFGRSICKDNVYINFTGATITGSTRNVSRNQKVSTISVLSSSTINADLPYSDYFINQGTNTVTAITGGKLGDCLSIAINNEVTFSCQTNKGPVTLPSGSFITFEKVDNNLGWWIKSIYSPS